MDNLLEFLSKRMSRHVVVSGDHSDLLIWGVRERNGVNLLGFSLNQLDTSQQSKRAEHLRKVGTQLSEKTGLTYIEIYYPADLIQNPLAKIRIDNISYPEGEAGKQLQNVWGTSQQQIGTQKEVNKHTADAFHAWARVNLPTSYVRMDIDAIITETSDASELVSLIEIKRSTAISVANWSPYTADIRNYFLEYRLADLADLSFYTLNHGCKDAPVKEDTLIGLHKISDVDLRNNRIISEKNIMNANQLANMLDSDYEVIP